MVEMLYRNLLPRTYFVLISLFSCCDWFMDHSSLSSSPNLRRVWDLPTRLFHWVLVLLMIGMVITGNIGGEMLQWHARMGYALLGTLVFRLIWGFVGGHWSRFVHFFPTPARVAAYVQGRHRPGHNPLGALSIFAVLVLLGMQLASGMMATDDISFNGPLNAMVSEDLADAATDWHKHLGKLLLLGWVVLHVLAIVWHKRKGHRLLPAMLHGDAQIANIYPESKDNWGRRLFALVLWLACMGLAFAYLLPLTV